MGQDVLTAPRGTARADVHGERARADGLLACGIVVGPLFLAVAAAQAFTIDGFDLGRHPISLLSAGDLGWIQIANFVAAGGLALLFAAGTNRVLVDGPGRTWAPLLLGGYGIGLIVAGVFTADPAFGFPPGTPDGAPEELSWHAVAHGVGFTLAFVSLTLACLVFARRFWTFGPRGWAVYSVATAVVALTLSMWPDRSGASVRYFVATVIASAWTTAIAARLRLRGSRWIAHDEGWRDRA
ncbi:MAG TPA: DUF998 domain-containing protein [Actinomycetota bacterium]|nr:DUF998 domain-containing protein [Actinomycetota bacterium]